MSYRSKEFEDGKRYERHGSPIFYSLLEEMANTHDRKSHDYADNSNPFGNYHFAGQVAGLFAHSPKDAGFAGRMAEKIYRIANLESGGKIPNNESVDDTERDIAVIATLWMADRRSRRLEQNQLEYRRFTNESRDMRDTFVRLANQLTPHDMEFTMNYLRDLLAVKQGGKSAGISGRTEFQDEQSAERK